MANPKPPVPTPSPVAPKVTKLTYDATKLPAVGGKKWTSASLTQWANKANMTPNEAYDFFNTGIKKFTAGATSAVESTAKPKNQISSAGAVLNTLNTTAAWATGAIDEGVKQIQTGKTTGAKAFQNVLDAGNKNANAWKFGERVKDNSSVLIDRFGWDSKNPWTYVAGFAGDVVLDPLNVIPAKGLASVAKGAFKGADKALTGAKLAGLGEESAAKAAARRLEQGKAKSVAKETEAYVAKLNETQVAKTGKELTPKEVTAALRTDAAKIAISKTKVESTLSGATKVPLSLTRLPGTAGEKIATATAKIAADQTYQTRKLTPAELKARTNVQAWQQAGAAALEAGRKGFVASLLSDNAISAAQKYVRQDRKMVWAPTLKTAEGERVTPATMIRGLTKAEPVVRTKLIREGNEWVVRSGNNVELGRAASKVEAEAISKQAKTPISASQLSKPDIAALYPKAPEVETITTKEAVKITTALPESSVVKQILKNVNVESESAGYGSFEALIAGLNAGDKISTDNLTRVLAALDPEKKIVPAAMKGENETKPDYLQQILVSPESQNYFDQLVRLDKAGDFENIVGVKGLGFVEEIGVYTRALQNPGSIPIDYQEAMLQVAIGDPNTATTAGAAASRYKTLHSARAQNLAEDGAKWAAESRNLRLDRIQAEGTYGRDASSFGQQVEFSNEAERLTGDTTAVLAEEFNSIFESVAIARASGNSRTEWVKDASALEAKGGDSYNPNNPKGTKATLKEEHAEFADYMYRRTQETSEALSDLLLAGNIRIQNGKFRGDDDFIKAYQQFGDEMRVKDVQNFVYVNISDVFKTFAKNGNDNLLKEAFFPFTTGEKYKTSSFLWQNLTDATRSALEMAAKGKDFNVAELEQRLLSRFKASKDVPKPRQAEMKALASQIVEALIDPRTIQELKRIHTQKSIGIINDYVNSTRNVVGSIAESTRSIWLAKIASGDASHTEKVKVLRTAFRELLAAIDLFKNEAGPVAESIARSYAAAFMRGKDPALNDIVDEAVKLELEQLAKDFVKIYEADKATDAAKIGERTGGKGGVKTKQEVQNLLVRRETEYSRLMAERDGIWESGDFKAWDEWSQKYKSVQKRLDESRASARARGIETRHWSVMRNTWVAPEHYDAVQEAEDALNTFTRKIPVDTAAILPEKMPAPNAATQADINKTQLDLQQGRIDDAANEADILLEQGVFAKEGRSEIDEVIRAVEHAETKPLIDAISLPDVKVHTVAGDYKTNKNNSYNPMLTEAQKAAGFARGGRTRKALDTWGGVYGAGWDQMSKLHVNAANAMDVSAQFSVVLRSMAAKWNGVDNQAFSNAWNALRAGKTEIKSQNEATQGLFNDLKRITPLIFGDNVNNELVKSGLSISDIASEMNRVGLGPKDGFPSAAATKDMTMSQFLESLPLGSKPKTLQSGTGGATQWAKNKMAMQKADFNEFQVLANIAHAVAQVKFKKGMMDDFFVRNDYRFYGLTRAEALAPGAGFIKPRVIGGKDFDMAYTKYIPDDALVLEDAWTSFGAVMREANALYNVPADAAWLKTMMNFNGFIKANQTVFVPGHQLTNAIGDGSLAINLGVTNPAWWGTGLRLANAHAVERATGDWFGEVAAVEGAGLGRRIEAGISKATSKLYKDPTQATGRGIDKLEMEIRNLFNTATSKTRAYEGTDATVSLEKASNTWVVKNSRGEVVERTTNKVDADRLALLRGNKTTGIIIYKNGKPVRVNFSDQDMIQMLRQNGVVISNILADDFQGLSDYLEGAKAKGGQGQFFRKAGARINLGYQTALKVPGDVVAWHGNIPRIAHAMKVLQSRSWSSIEDAMAGAAREVNKYHPTIQTLRSKERKLGRAFIGYYTWLKSAHMATLDMLVTRPALVTIPSKFQKETSESLGFEPESIGSPYKNQESVAPWFRNSPVGMLVNKPEDAYIVKLPFMQPQVLDTFSFTWDNSKSTDENVWASLRTGAATLGGMIGPLAKRTAEVLWRVDPDTGLPSVVKDSRTAFDSVASDFSIFQLLKGLGVYTPASKDPELGKTAVTPAEKDAAEINWWTRIGLTPLYTPGALKGARLDNAAVQKRLEKMGMMPTPTEQIPEGFDTLNPFVQQYLKDLGNTK